MSRYSTLSPLPERISRLDELAVDLWWSWQPDARAVFRRLDYTLWRATAHNPVRMMWVVPRQKLEAAAQDPEFLRRYDRAIAALDAARGGRDTWWAARFPHFEHRSIAYFSAEFALHQSLAIYAGGLGVLAGDHCKEASDLGVPLIGIGFMYPQGYFHQHVSVEGWQEESYERLNWADAPIEPAITRDGKPCITAVPLGDRTVLVAVWRVRLGRVKLYLLDTDLEENAPWDRELSARLYGGDRETRIQQEIILGIGGVRALKLLGSDPAVFHLNEGHAAFVVLQRIRDLIEQGSNFDHALEEIRATTVFTTHTPVRGRSRCVSVPPRRKTPGRLLGDARREPRSVPGARLVRQRQRHAVQHDRPRAAIGRKGQCRQPAACRGDPSHVGADVAGSARARSAGRSADQRRAPRHLAGR